MAKITIQPQNKTIEIDGEKDFLQAFRAEELYVKSSCGGHASCSDCIIKVIDGMDNLNKPTFEETQLLGNVFHITKERLACQCIAHGDVTVDLSNHNLSSDEERLRGKTTNFVKKK